MKKVKIFSDPFLIIGYAISNLIFIAFIVWAAYYTEGDAPLERLGFISIFFGLWLMLVVTLIIIAPRWGRWFVFKQDCFECHTFFRKKIISTYDNYRIYFASYFHGTPTGFGSERGYIILSQKMLNHEERENVNEVNPKGVYKLTYSKKRFEALISILPERLSTQLQDEENWMLRAEMFPRVSPQKKRKKRKKKK